MKTMEDNVPQISIITVCYNASATIEKTIKSVISQQYPHLEYIIIDGGSKDHTLEVIGKYQNYLSLVISEPDKGPFDAMNKGILKAKGEIIGIINADDWYEDGVLSAVGNAFIKQKEIEVVCGNMQYWDGNEKGKLSLAVLDRLKKEMSLNHPTVFVKKKTYLQHGNFNLQFKLASDYELMLRFYIKGCKFLVLDQCISNMSLRGMSDLHWKKSLKEVLEIKLLFLNPTNVQLEYYEIYAKELMVRTMKNLSIYGLYKAYKNLLGSINGKGKRF